jgi:hypothetical protein
MCHCRDHSTGASRQFVPFSKLRNGVGRQSPVAQGYAGSFAQLELAFPELRPLLRKILQCHGQIVCRTASNGFIGCESNRLLRGPAGAQPGRSVLGSQCTPRQRSGPVCSVSDFTATLKRIALLMVAGVRPFTISILLGVSEAACGRWPRRGHTPRRGSSGHEPNARRCRRRGQQVCFCPPVQPVTPGYALHPEFQCLTRTAPTGGTAEG